MSCFLFCFALLLLALDISVESSFDANVVWLLQDSPTILEEPESPLNSEKTANSTSSSSTSATTTKSVDTPRSEPIPITVSAYKERKSRSILECEFVLTPISVSVSNVSNDETLASPPTPTTVAPNIGRSNSLATERAHSLESDKVTSCSRLDVMKKMEDSTMTALSWNDVTGVMGGSANEGRGSAHSHHHHHHHHHHHAASTGDASDASANCSRPGCRVRTKGHRHSIPAQLMRLFNFSDFQFGSSSRLFSTAVISGSSSAPNLQDTVEVPGKLSLDCFLFHL